MRMIGRLLHLAWRARCSRRGLGAVVATIRMARFALAIALAAAAARGVLRFVFARLIRVGCGRGREIAFDARNALADQLLDGGN